MGKERTFARPAIRRGVTMSNPKTPEYVFGRLYNWKFNDAKKKVATVEDVAVVELINSLSDSFGNSGWFGGSMGTIVRNALENIGVTGDCYDGKRGTYNIHSGADQEQGL